MAVDRIDVEEVLGVFQEVFVYSRASLSVHAGKIPRRGPAVRYHVHAGTAFFQGDVRLALHGNGLVVSACKAEVPFVADFVVVDALAVPRGEPFAERAEGPGGRRPHRTRIPDCVRAGLFGHRPARRLEDYRVERDSVLLELAKKFVRASEFPAVRTIRLDARHVREIGARKFRSAGDKGGRGNAAVAVREPREVPVDAEAEGPARLFRRDGVEVHDGEASIDGRDASVVRGKFATDSPHAFGIAYMHRDLDCLSSIECNVHRQINHVTDEPFNLQRSLRGDFFLRGVVYCENGPFALPFPNDMQRIPRLRLDAQRPGFRRV